MEKTLESAPQLYLAIDLGGSRWQLAFADGSAGRPRRRSVPARDLPALWREIELAKHRFELAADAPVASVYEAGRDGFWLHRVLVAEGVHSVIVDPSSMKVEQRAKRAKTDGLDSEAMLDCLVRQHRGDRKVWRLVNVPSEADEDVRRLLRERKRVLEERTSVSNRAHSLLATVGIKLPSLKALGDSLRSLRTAENRPLPKHLARELKRIVERLDLLEEQLEEIEKERQDLLEQDSERIDKVKMLGMLRGIGKETAWTLVLELFAWRKIQNRRQLGALAGLTGTPHRSDNTAREQGISKAGNPRIRALMVEIAWQWVRYQPESELTLWYQRRFAPAGGRARKRGIVALARKLLIALWHFVEHGLVPEGVELKPEGAALR